MPLIPTCCSDFLGLAHATVPPMSLGLGIGSLAKSGGIQSRVFPPFLGGSMRRSLRRNNPNQRPQTIRTFVRSLCFYHA